MALDLTVAVSAYDRTRALLDGRIGIEGCNANVLDLEPEEMFHRSLHFGEFDVTELSFSNYLTMTAAGECPYIGIPIFPARKFRHSGIFINTKSGIKSAEDLAGKTIGTPEYTVTAVTWVRGILEDEFGVKPTDMKWCWGGLREAGRAQKTSFNIPEGLVLEPAPKGQTLQNMLAAGDIDAIISPRAPNCFLEGHPDVARLFPDFIEREKDYFNSTGIFPIMHLMGIRKELAEAQPWLADSVCKAFNAAKAVAYLEITEDNIPRVTNPWMEAHTAEVQALMGNDFWPYGMEENRKPLEAFLRYHFDQGLADKRLSVEEIFVPSTLSHSRI
ncbi:MAG: ABC transporter substrate-binding protein [Rhodospirillales bacterium]|jgi:4,5-dihydroxyphthalate decarboxylase|nr:ABC transporter substrate-binding protein [Rhodospirillales bacterium]MBT4006610.1 ABC transporter substrate-binding protein [Rhodospirillales bacterium]MBT5075347.1 ABC transporter substrate-binding protein [Rhodospirillales bacterium]MBT5113888.1 ABC transporter substrate-binding protein [Rhodospirillales bacterium]MBT5672416.1 ABC transporter substrate-binding protein [Rhodospirillales bacterium]